MVILLVQPFRIRRILWIRLYRSGCYWYTFGEFCLSLSMWEFEFQALVLLFCHWFVGINAFLTCSYVSFTSFHSDKGLTGERCVEGYTCEGCSYSQQWMGRVSPASFIQSSLTLFFVYNKGFFRKMGKLKFGSSFKRCIMYSTWKLGNSAPWRWIRERQWGYYLY